MLVKKIFEPQIFPDPKFLYLKVFLTQIIFAPQKFEGQNKCWVKKIVCPKMSESNKIVGPQNFESKEILSRN